MLILYLVSIPTSGKNAEVDFFGARGHCEECSSQDKRLQTLVGNECIYGKIYIMCIWKGVN